MKRGNKLLLLLVALLVVVAIFMLLPKFNSEDKQDDEQSNQLVSIITEDITNVDYTYDDVNIIFDKQNDTWVLQDNADMEIEASLVDDIVNTITNISYSKKLNQISDLSEYGLDKPMLTVTLNDQYKYSIGDLNSISNEYYLMDREGGVYLVAEDIVSLFFKNASDFKKLDEFPDISSLSKLKVTIGEAESKFEKLEDGWYFGKNGEKQIVDTDLAQTALDNIISLKWKSRVTSDVSEAELETYGLSEPQITFEITYDGGELKLLVGSSIDDGTMYAMLDGDTNVYTVENTPIMSFYSLDVSSLVSIE